MAILQLRQKHGNALKNKLVFEYPTKKNRMISVFICRNWIDNNY